jgi:hypothetical protein
MPQQGITQLEILSGWKEIASYLGKGVRTVQRYEAELGLPIRRPAGKSMGSIVATTVEIDAWVSARPLREEFRLSVPAIDNIATFKRFRQEMKEMHRLREETVQLRSDLTASREALRLTVELLHRSLRAGFAEEDQIQRLSSSRRRTADVQIFDP